MKNSIIAFVLIYLVLGAGCATTQESVQTQQAKPQEEGLQWSVPAAGTHWVTGNSKYIEGKYSITELVPKGETVNNWSELLTIQNFAAILGTPEAFLDQLKTSREKLCPGTTTWNVIAKDEHSILYEWQAKPCVRWPDQHEISRIIDGQWNRFRIAYTAKVKEISVEKRDLMIQSMSEAAVKLKEN